jgi:hypothetical protein
MTDTTDTAETVETSAELELYEPQPPTTLFHTDNPDVALERMGAIAKTLVDVIEQRTLYATINGRRFVTSEGWTTLGAMLGVHAIVTETRPNETGDGIVARAEARTLAGQIVGAAEAECSRAERRWNTAEPYAIRSMAQTRAISRALRAPLGQIVVLAGYEPTGAEEIPTDDTPVASTDKDRVPPDRGPTREQMDRISHLLTELTENDPGTDWKAEARRIAGVPGDMLTSTIADMLINELEQASEERAP